VTRWGSTTNRILALPEHLATQQVTCVVMEATGGYWNRFYYLLEVLHTARKDLLDFGLGGRRCPAAMPPGWAAEHGSDPLTPPFRQA
jgi:hypothetical protein